MADQPQWPKARFNAANPNDPDNRQLYERHEWESLGVSPTNATNLETGAIVGISIQNADGAHHGMLQRYTLDDSIRDAAPDLLARVQAGAVLVEQMREWADLLQKGGDRRGVIAGLREVAGIEERRNAAAIAAATKEVA